MTAGRQHMLQVKQAFNVGIEVDADLRQPLDESNQAELRRLLDSHGILVFRNQNLTHPEQVRVLGYLGSVLQSADGIGYISTDPGKGGLGMVELAFHSDLAFTPSPFKVISLHAIDVVDGQTSTRFADGVRACKALPVDLCARLAGLQVRSVMPLDMATDRLDEEVSSAMPQFVHPVITTHPNTGTPILYVNQQHAARIEGLDKAASKALLAELFGYLYRPENIYEHIWHNGDFVIWDNLATQHARGQLYGLGPRTLQRVVVADKSFFELCPQFRPGDPDYDKWVKPTDPEGSKVSIEQVAARATTM